MAKRARRAAPVLPALAGLAAPYWDAQAEGIASGLTLATDRADLARGFLEGVAFLLGRIVRAATPVEGFRRVTASGGLSSLNTLMQAQTNALGRPIVRSRIRDTSAWGAAALAGVGAGVWQTVEDTARLTQPDRVFEPAGERREIDSRLKAWEVLVKASRDLGVYTDVSHSG
jgi:glycerol kinase